MKIAIDGGALCTKKTNRYGNYTFSQNCIQALSYYNKQNNYSVYSFCHRPDWFPKNIDFQRLFPKQLWMSFRIPLEQSLKPKKIFLAFNQAVPYIGKTKIISISHGLSFCFFPHLYPDSYKKMLRQIKLIFKKSAWIIVSSGRVKKEFNQLFPWYKKIVVNPFGIPFDMIETKKQPRKKYFMFVGMNHPIKNVDFIVRVFEEFIKEKKYSQYKLKLIGDFKKYANYKNVQSLTITNRKKLKQLYQRATGYLAPSFYESFNLPVLEALSQNCPAVGLESAIIPEVRQYVQMADSFNTFIRQMKIIADKQSPVISLSQLKKTFSWKKYVKKLTLLYD